MLQKIWNKGTRAQGSNVAEQGMARGLPSAGSDVEWATPWQYLAICLLWSEIAHPPSRPLSVVTVQPNRLGLGLCCGAMWDSARRASAQPSSPKTFGHTHAAETSWKGPRSLVTSIRSETWPRGSQPPSCLDSCHLVSVSRSGFCARRPSKPSDQCVRVCHPGAASLHEKALWATDIASRAWEHASTAGNHIKRTLLHEGEIVPGVQSVVAVLASCVFCSKSLDNDPQS